MDIGLSKPPDWMDGAACASSSDPDRWFRADSLHHVAELAYVRAICESCAVNPQCLEYALECHAQGVWAGTTTAERRKMRRKARR